ncbi:hypothetical protein HDU84_003577 [Entophlyctis sp. JEL0112]|nr:hypothetical protein HDU84_003577 [Entophlyctis sp. JEL0112]
MINTKAEAAGLTGETLDDGGFVLVVERSSLALFGFVVGTNLKRSLRKWQSNLLIVVVLPLLILGFMRWTTTRPDVIVVGSLEPKSLPDIASACGSTACSAQLGILDRSPNASVYGIPLSFDLYARAFNKNVTIKNFNAGDTDQAYDDLVEATRGTVGTGSFDVAIGLVLSVTTSGVEYQLVGRQSILMQYGYAVQAYIGVLSLPVRCVLSLIVCSVLVAEDAMIDFGRSFYRLPALPATSDSFSVISIPFVQRNLISLHCLALAVFMYAISSLVVYMVASEITTDRASGFRQITELAGLTPQIELVALFVSSLPKMVVLAFVVTAFFFADSSLSGSNPFFVFAVLFVGLMAHISLAMLISFRVKSVSVITTVMMVLLLVDTFTVKEFFIDGATSTAPLYFTWFLPPSSLGLAVACMHQNILLGADLPVFADPLVKTYFFKLLLQALAYLVLTVYLDAVTPGFTWAAQLPAHFFLLPSYWRRPKYLAKAAEYAGLQKSILELRLDRNTFGGTYMGVNKIHADCYGGEATSLLGHNGAGKTTLICLINGIRKIANGTIRFICPTQDGVQKLDLADGAQLSEFVRHVGFCPQQNALTKELSAFEHLEFMAKIRGVKKVFRKNADGTLSAVSLSDYILDLLDSLEFQENRISHDMEEASALSDSVLVIAGGILQEKGTPIDLKDKYSQFLRLHIQKSRSFNRAKTDELLSSLFRSEGNVEFLSESGTTVTYTVPKIASFSEVIKHLNAERSRLGIVDVEVSVETLEEVFMRITTTYERLQPGVKERNIFHEILSPEQIAELEKAEQGNLKKVVDTRQWNALRQFRTKKTFGISDGADFLVGSFRMLVFMLVGMFLSNGIAINSFGELIQFPQKSPIPLAQLNHSSALKSYVPSISENTADGSVLISRIIPSDAFTLTDPSFPLAQAILSAAYVPSIPDVPSILACALSEDHWVTNSSYNSGTNSPCGTGFMIRSWEVVNSNVSEGLNAKVSLIVDDMLQPFANSQSWLNLIGSVQTIIQDLLTTDKVGEHQPPNVPLLNVDDFNAGKLVNLFNAAKSGVLGFPITFSYFRFWDGSDNISLVAYRFVVPAFVAGQTAAFLTVIARYAKEYYSHLGHHMQVHGLSPSQYMLSHTYGALITGAIHSAFVVFFILVVPVGFANAGIVVATVLLNQLILVVSVVPAISLVERYGPKMFAVFNSGIYVSILFWLIVRSAIGSALDSKAWVAVSVLNPVWSLYEGQLSVLLSQTSSANQNYQIAIGIQAAQLLCAVLLSWYLLTPRKTAARPSDFEVPPSIPHGLSIVNLEYDYEAKNTNNAGVLRGVSFDVAVGEVYGLLGSNGCGKSTTMKCLLGQNRSARGYAAVNNRPVIPFNMGNIHGNFGYCPQDDFALLPSFSIRDHLNLYCAIKKVPPSQRASTIEKIMEAFELPFGYPNQILATLSGGTKRKLSLALAYLAEPTVVLVDGVSAAHFARPLITNVSRTDIRGRCQSPRVDLEKYCCFQTSGCVHFDGKIALHKHNVLTSNQTHSMEEADFICSKIGFLINGKLGASGDPIQIKSVISVSYDLFLRVSTNSATSAEVLAANAVQYVKDYIDRDAKVLKCTNGSIEMDISLAESNAVISSDEKKFSGIPPEKKLNRIAQVLEELEAAQSLNKIEGLLSFAVSQKSSTTVFLNYLAANGGLNDDD